ncbi:uncharacterized protein [Antedon mediterranea]|uniref:uncharacterized protein n=1 Tax=Antedon mediterranea TaxID=105859 RepID=UPI003AF597E2
MEKNVEEIEVESAILLKKKEADGHLQKIKDLEDELLKERELRNESETCNSELKSKILELQNEISIWKKDERNNVDVATQTVEDEGTISEQQVEPTSIADSIRDAAESAMTNSGFVYDETSGLYYDYTSGYYYNPENHLYYDTNTGTYYYFNESTSSYEFHSQVEIPEESQRNTVEYNMHYDRKQDNRSREKRVKEKYRHTPERENLKTENRKRKDRQLRSETPDRSKNKREDKREKRYKEEKKCDRSISNRRKEKRHKRDRYDESYSRSDKDRRCKHKKHHKKKKRKDKNDSRRLEGKNPEQDEVEETKVKKRTENEKYEMSEKEKIEKGDKIEKDDKNKKGEKKEANIAVISPDESDVEEGEIEEVEENMDDVEEGEVEEGEIASSSSSKSVSEISSLSDISSDSMSDVSDEEMDEEMEEREEVMEKEVEQVNRREYPPCIRMIVTKSESLQPGSLFIITCMGGSIGREGEHTVLIPEIGISKNHAEIFYCQNSWQYYIRDLGSQNGTLINAKPIGESRSESEAQILSHKDYLTIGGTMLRLHIHPGAETCDDCEPGQVQALLAQTQPKGPLILSNDKEQQRRKGLKQMKKKYGLTRETYVETNSSTANPAYTDRSDIRRKTVGSDNPHQKDDLPASVDREIASDNVGRKMMEKMGWKSGETLGKDNTGIKEPINVLSNNKRAGLGGQARRTISDLALGNLQSEKWERARARYNALEEPAPKPISMKITQPKKMGMMWTSGGIIKSEPKIKIENIFGSDDDDEKEEEDKSMKITQPKKMGMMWTSGGVIKSEPKIKKENIFGSDDEEEEEDKSMKITQPKKMGMMWTSGGVIKSEPKIKIENISDSDDDEEDKSTVK